MYSSRMYIQTVTFTAPDVKSHECWYTTLLSLPDFEQVRKLRRAASFCMQLLSFGRNLNSAHMYLLTSLYRQCLTSQMTLRAITEYELMKNTRYSPFSSCNANNAQFYVWLEGDCSQQCTAVVSCH